MGRAITTQGVRAKVVAKNEENVRALWRGEGHRICQAGDQAVYRGQNTKNTGFHAWNVSMENATVKAKPEVGGNCSLDCAFESVL
jgi:hypothetical protein